MKTRFSSLDVAAIIPQLKEKICTGWRVNQVYDCDAKTYLFKLNKSIVQMKKDEDNTEVDEEVANKLTMIIESGVRIHTTDYDWNKSPAPSNFAVKLRKHLKNKRVVNIRQIGKDRLVELQFGSNDAANYLIIELYDKGNIILTDFNHNVLTILRWRKQNVKESNSEDLIKPSPDYDSENLKVGQPYPFRSSRSENKLNTIEEVKEILFQAPTLLIDKANYRKKNKLKRSQNEDSFHVNLKTLLNPFVECGSNLLEDRLLEHVFNNDPSVKQCSIDIALNRGVFEQSAVEELAPKLLRTLKDANEIHQQIQTRSDCPGYILQRRNLSEMSEQLISENNAKVTNVDFFPVLSCVQRRLQIETTGDYCYEEFETFDKAVDIYFSNLESQRIDSKAMSVEKDALKKLENLKLDHQKRLDALASVQKEDEEKARLIELNNDKVESALTIIRSMVVHQMSWDDIWNTVKEAQKRKDPIASLITGMKFDKNQFSMKLNDPYEENSNNKHPKYKVIDIDLSLSAYANARKFFTRRRTAANKEQKTKEVSKKAYKNVEKSTKEMLREVVTKSNITKARKRYWFENFHWFISSDGYLVVAGRDAEQNDMLVKRYMKNNDIYVHADLHGASTVIIKNEFSKPVPPKTLTEAGTMAVCYSSAWDAKIAITSWWVYPNQVSKSAPTGEYLTTGAFIIRGKKNYLPISYLILGFGFLFRLDEESIERRKKERIRLENTRQIDKILIEELVVDGCYEKLEEQNESLENVISSEQDNVSSDDFLDDNDEDTKPTSTERVSGDASSDEEYEEEGQDDEGEKEQRLIDTLSESPGQDDVILYAIPMCGPYSALQNYKFKVKVIPGTTKRGKAAKSVLGMFLHDKTASQREKNLLKVYKDQDFGRDLPSKVKISSANMTKLNMANKKHAKNKKTSS